LSANLQQYTLLYGTVNGSLLTEEASISVKRASNSSAVNTVAKGYAGESPGAANCTIDVKNAVPAAGFEFDAGPVINGLIPAEIGVVGPGGQRLIVPCFIIEDSIDHSVGSASNYDFQARGRFPLWR
jgi:hypothetical protein